MNWSTPPSAMLIDSNLVYNIKGDSDRKIRSLPIVNGADRSVILIAEHFWQVCTSWRIAPSTSIAFAVGFSSNVRWKVRSFRYTIAGKLICMIFTSSWETLRLFCCLFRFGTSTDMHQCTFQYRFFLPCHFCIPRRNANSPVYGKRFLRIYHLKELSSSLEATSVYNLPVVIIHVGEK